jgi:hypothetical protein
MTVSPRELGLLGSASAGLVAALVLEKSGKNKLALSAVIAKKTSSSYYE